MKFEARSGNGQHSTRPENLAIVQAAFAFPRAADWDNPRSGPRCCGSQSRALRNKALLISPKNQIGWAAKSC
jgi:hypothetical protein